MKKKSIDQLSIKKTLIYLWQFMRDEKWLFFTANFFATLALLIGFFWGRLYLKEFFDIIVEYSDGIRGDAVAELTTIIIKITAVFILSFWILTRVSEYFLGLLVPRVMKKAEIHCFSRVLEHSPDFFANNFVGSLTSKFGRFIRTMEGFNSLMFFNFLPNIIRFLLSILFIGYFAPIIAISLFIWGIIFFWVIFYLSKKYRLPNNLKIAQNESKISGKNADAFSNILPIKMFTHQKFEINFFRKTVDLLYKCRRKGWSLWLKINIFQSCMISILEISSLYIMMQMWANGTMTVGTIIIIQSFLLQIYLGLWNIGRDIRDFFQGIGDIEEMMDILTTPADIQDPKNPEKCQISSGEIVFKDMEFSYNNQEKVFDKFNLTIKSGEKIGIVGESGAGKSTITKLLLRFSDINAGSITIDGQKISHLTQNDLRSNIAFVPQESVLFHRSLMDNIRYGNSQATDEEVYNAAKKAHALDFIEKTPEKWETFVGERGVKLSGGERQRIAIARAILKNSPILMLDEASSALDSHAESLIQDALENLMKNRTTIVIAHRLSTLKKMDRILVLDHGSIIEDGAHKTLLKQKGKYAYLWEKQVGGFV